MAVIVTYDYTEIYKIPFKFHASKYEQICETIITFDTETSNGVRLDNGVVIAFDHEQYANSETYRDLISNGEKVSLLYLWQCAIESGDDIIVFLGRTYDDYLTFSDILTKEILRQSIKGFKTINRDVETVAALHCKKYCRCFIYVHNFAFDYQHLRNIYNDEFSHHAKERGVTFAREPRKPMKTVITTNYVRTEYRDSYVLTQKSLKNWCKDSHLAISKLEEPQGFYLVIRTPNTQLTDEEISYGANDVASMVLGIMQYRNKCGCLEKISLTQTGEVRKKCIEEVARKNQAWSSQCYTVQKEYSFEFFSKLCKLFCGGWTHANAKYVNKLLNNIRCFDFASSYPAVMTSRTYPTSSFIEYDPCSFAQFCDADIHTTQHHWFAKLRFDNVVSKLDNSYFSTSKATNQLFNVVADNGRVKACDELECYLTDLDFDTFRQAYNFDSVDCLELYVSNAEYLPRELVQLILDYYKYKTSLKGVAGSESLYAESKQFINSIYGCAVTKIVSDAIDFLDEWIKTPCDELIFADTMKHLKLDQFLSYQCGIWVTSWARHNLWDLILHLDQKIVYCDTDSIKGFFDDDDLKWIDDYNQNIAKIETTAASVLGIDFNLYCATTSKGKVKRLGILEREDDCEEFKTLGAKRYCCRHGNEIELTVAGLPKKAGSKLSAVDEFCNRLTWDTRESYKNVVYYNDHQSPCVWTDRDGNKYRSVDQYGACILPTTFVLDASQFLKFIESNIDYNTTPICLLD